MDSFAHAIRETPRFLAEEITRYGGLNPFGKPSWRVVLAQRVLDQTFGVMRHMPVVSAEACVDEIEPERVETGEFWTPRYQGEGWILERWFPASAWGSLLDWRLQLSEDGATRMMGQYPRQGEYWMVSTEFLRHCPEAGYWKRQINEELQRMAAMPGDPARVLSKRLYEAKVAEERRKERFVEEVNRVHRGVVDPLLATVGGTAQRVRDRVAQEAGMTGNLAAG